MSGTLDSLVEGGGSPLVPVAHVSALIGAGATGTLLSVTAGAGQYIKLNELSTMHIFQMTLKNEKII